MSTSNPRYTRLHRNKFLTLDATCVEDMVAAYKTAYDEFAAMAATGKVWLMEDGAGSDHATLGTDCPDVAEQFGFQEADEAFGEDFDDPDDDDDGDSDTFDLDDVDWGDD